MEREVEKTLIHVVLGRLAAMADRFTAGWQGRLELVSDWLLRVAAKIRMLDPIFDQSNGLGANHLQHKQTDERCLDGIDMS